MTCKHEHPRGLTWDGDGYGWMTGGDDARICRWCGHWLSLGDSNDADERVGVEIRAASMVACHETDSRCRCFDLSKRLAPIGREREARDLAAEIMYPDLYARHVAERDEDARVIAETSGGGGG